MIILLYLYNVLKYFLFLVLVFGIKIWIYEFFYYVMYS